MVVVGRHLHGEAAARPQRPDQRASTSAWSGTQCSAALANTRSWSAEDVQRAMSAGLEARALVGVVSRGREHVRRVVDTDHGSDVEP